MVASAGWVELYLKGGRVVNLEDGKPVYPAWKVMADVSQGWEDKVCLAK